jgi:hypothetical protein
MSRAMRTSDLDGYDEPFRLRCWPTAAGKASHQLSSRDPAELKSEALRLVSGGACSRVELLGWNFELNDWVRMEMFEAP